MRIAIIAAAAAVALSGPALAKGNPQMKACAAKWDAMKKAGQTGGQTYKQFSTTCLSSGTQSAPPTAPAPESPSAPPAKPSAAATASAAGAPAGATAKCKDGTYSMSAHHSGSCSHHGGVAQFLK